MECNFRKQYHVFIETHLKKKPPVNQGLNKAELDLWLIFFQDCDKALMFKN